MHYDASYFRHLKIGCVARHLKKGRVAGIIRDSRENFLFGFYMKLGESDLKKVVEAQKPRRLSYAKPSCNARSDGKKNRKKIHVKF